VGVTEHFEFDQIAAEELVASHTVDLANVHQFVCDEGFVGGDRRLYEDRVAVGAAGFGWAAQAVALGGREEFRVGGHREVVENDDPDLFGIGDAQLLCDPALDGGKGSALCQGHGLDGFVPGEGAGEEMIHSLDYFRRRVFEVLALPGG
jgi:hypothetical protein